MTSKKQLQEKAITRKGNYKQEAIVKISALVCNFCRVFALRFLSFAVEILAHCAVNLLSLRVFVAVDIVKACYNFREALGCS